MRAGEWAGCRPAAGSWPAGDDWQPAAASGGRLAAASGQVGQAGEIADMLGHNDFAIALPDKMFVFHVYLIGILPSMSRDGTCDANAMLHATLMRYR